MNKWDLIKEINKYLKITKENMALYEEEYQGIEVEGLMQEYLDDGDEIAFLRLQWETRKYIMNITIVKEREAYLRKELYPTFRCPED